MARQCQNSISEKNQQAQLRPVSERGRVLLNKMDYQPHRKTLHNYAALNASEKNIYITTSAILKTCTRYTAENSLISAMELLCVISATHYEVVSETSSNVDKDIRKYSIGVKKLHKVVLKYTAIYLYLQFDQSLAFPRMTL